MAELERLTTPRLLAYLRRLLECEESIERSDWESKEVPDDDNIVFKSSEQWKSQYELVKSVLATRPNIDK